MPQHSNEELDELDSLLEAALQRQLPDELVISVCNALDIIRSARSTMGAECTPRELVQFLEMLEPGRRVLH